MTYDLQDDKHYFGFTYSFTFRTVFINRAIMTSSPHMVDGAGIA